MGFNMGKRNKRSSNQGRKNGLRDAHRRSRGKEKTMARQEMIDGKMSGDRFDEDIVSSSDRRRGERSRGDGDDDVVLATPKVTRTVQLGVPRGKNKFASTDASGRTTVREDKFRKGSTESWNSYRATLRRSMTAESGGLAQKRVEKRTSRESYLESLEEILGEMLHFEVLPAVYAGTRGQGQRRRLFGRIKRGLSATQCVIVPDGGQRPTVVFAYRVVMLQGSEGELNSRWMEIFRPEHDYAARRTQPSSDQVFPAEHQGMFFDSEDAWMMSKGFEFSVKYGVGDASNILDQLKVHGPMIARMCADLYALSLVPAEKRREYLIVRGAGMMISSPACRKMACEIFNHLSASTAVVAFVTAFQTTGRTEPVDSSTAFDAEHQAFPEWDAVKVGDMLKKVRGLDLSPGTVVNALVLVVAAGWTLTHAKGGNAPVASIFSCAKRLSGVGKCDTVDDAVDLLVRAVPVVVSAVSAAIAAKSLAPFLVRKSSLFEDFVAVRAAYDLHKTGQYPNSAFLDRDAFVRALASVHRRFADEAKTRVVPVEVKQHLVLVNTMYNEVVNNLSGQFREAPYAVAIVGGSGIGKSVLTRFVADRVIRADGGAPLSKTDIYIQQPTDKFASGYDMSKRVVVLDDLCNQRPTQGCALPCIPTAIIIDTINNVMTPTNQADLASKGKIFWNPRVVVATSNVLSLGAHVHSNEPVSILRRFNWFVEPTVRDRFRVRGGSGLDPAGDYSLPMTDVWTFDVYRWIPAENDAGMVKVYCEGLDKGCDIFALLAFLECDSVAYFDKQRELAASIDGQAHVDHDIDALRRMSSDAQVRAEHQMFPCVPAEGLLDGSEPVDSPGAVVDDSFTGVPAYESPVSGSTGVDSQRYLSHSEYLYARTMESFEADRAKRAREVRRAQLISDVRYYFDPALGSLKTIARSVAKEIDMLMAAHLVLVVLACLHPVCSIPLLIHLYTCYRFGLTARRVVSRTAIGATGLASGVAFFAWLALRGGKKPVAEQQGIVEFTMGEKADVVQGGPPAPEAPTTTTVANLSAAVSRNAIYVTMNAGHSVSIAILTPLKTGLYVGNYHTFHPILKEARRLGQFDVVFTRLKGTPQTHTVPFANLWTPGYDKCDIMFLKLNGPAEVDVTGYLMPFQWLHAMGSGQRMPIRDSTLSLLRAPMECKRGLLDAVGKLSLVQAQTFGLPHLISCRFEGAPGPLKMIGTKCAVTTEKGDCGSPYFVRTSQGSGGGAYLAGVMAGRVALGAEYSLAIAPITDRLVAAAVDALQSVQTYSAAPLFGMAPETRLSPNRVHPDLPTAVEGVVSLGVLTDAQGVNTSSLNSFRSRLKVSPFCDLPAVMEQLGPVAHKTPPNPTSTQHFARTVGRMERKLVPETNAERLAVEDLAGQLGELVERHRGGLGPMSLFESINGRGDIGPYPLDTSPGFGFKGKKSSFFQLACVAGGCGDGACALYHPTEDDYLVPGRQLNYYPGPELLAQIEDLRTRLLSGEVDLAVFRAALKDESVDMSKEKIRVFFVGMMSWNILIRQLYAPLLSIMKQDRLGSECAVGMDCLSADWEQLMDHLDEYNASERLAGDYSNYDNSIHSRLIGRAYSVIEGLGRAATWDRESLRLMSGIGRNMTNPIYIVLGMVVRADGTNPSGVAITTWINSLVNSLVHRIAYYTKNPVDFVSPGDDGLYPFQRSIRLSTYGDDVLGAVRSVPGVVAITNHDVRDAADRLGMMFGPIDKGSAYFPPSYSVSEVSFLKCVDTYVPQLKRRVGMVAQASVRKCLTFERNSDFEARRNTAESALRLFYVRALVEEREEGFGSMREQLLSALLPRVEDSIAREGLLPDLAAITSSLLSPDKVAPVVSTTDWWEVGV